MSKTVLGCLGIVLVGVLVLAFLGVGQYNGLVQVDQGVGAAWSEVENHYQRRADLVPNLVATVKGAADFEQQTLQRVVEARSRVGQVSAEAGADILDDPQRFARFQQAQDELSGALSRLLVVVERYPELHATQNFADLQHQLEGTENRVAVARTRFNEAAREYNTRLKRVPTRWFVGLLGWSFRERPYFEAKAGAAEAPKVEF